MRIVILRDPRESPKKCSLTPLRGRPNIEFLRYEPGVSYDFHGMTLLDPEGPPLTKADRGRPLLVLDCSWRKVPVLRSCVRGEVYPRSVPKGFVSAFPRRSKTFQDPSNGLASVEALYIACEIFGEPDSSLLEGYFWRDRFFERNRVEFSSSWAPFKGST